jgi:ATP-dependent DNA helicase RecG
MPAVLDQVIEFMESNTGSHAAVIGTRREIIAEYPPSVLREAVLNALAHRDYGLAGVTVDITVWDDRVEVHSPGSLPGHITLDNIRQEHYSRNRSVMTVLKVLNLVEEYGEGVDRMYDEMEARLMEPPAFAVTPSSVTVTLRNRSLLGVEDQAWLSVLGHLELSPAERRLLVLARREGEVTRRRVRAAMPEVGADVLLSGAVAKGLIVRVGERGGSRYVLSDEVVVRAGASGVEARSRQRQMLLDEIRRRGSISTTEAAEFLAEPDVNMVRHLLQDLTRANLAVARGRTRGRRYYSE